MDVCGGVGRVALEWVVVMVSFRSGNESGEMGGVTN
jgi:hypothetical protein